MSGADKTSGTDLPADLVQLVLCVLSAVVIVMITEGHGRAEPGPETAPPCADCAGGDGY